MKKKKNSKRKILVNKLDKLTREKCFEKHGKRCYTCGGSKGDEVIQCGHLITRSKYATRWDLRNVRPQCRSCNFEHEHNPHTYITKYIEENGLDNYEKLVKDSWSSSKLTIVDLEYIYEILSNN